MKDMSVKCGDIYCISFEEIEFLYHHVILQWTKITDFVETSKLCHFKS